MALDLLLVNGRVVIPESGETEVAIGIEGGRIAALLSGTTLPPAAETIDLAGKVVLPGLVDPHTHMKVGAPDGWFTETRAGALGGVTTLIDYQTIGTSYMAGYEKVREEADRRSTIDYGLHFCPCVELHLEELDRYIEELGVPSFKFFMNFRGDEGAYLGVAGADDSFLYELCRRLARHPQTVLSVHAENIEIAHRLEVQLIAEGREGLVAWAASRPPIVEAENVHRAAYFSRVTGATVNVAHMSTAASLEVLRRARRDGAPMYGETCPHYLTHTMDSPLGNLAKCNPPLQKQEDVDALWEGLADGSVSTVGSDHCSRPKAAKGGSIWKASRGGPGISMILPVLLSEGVHRRGLSLQQVAQLGSTNAARQFNLYPRKGTIRPGSDADLVVVDLDQEHEVHWQDLQSYVDYTIYEGWKFKGWPVMTISRGRIIARDGAFLGEAGTGRYLPR